MLSFTLKLSGYLATSIFLTQLENSTRHNCVKSCYHIANCNSFFFNTGTGLCQLEGVVYSNTNDLSEVNDVFYFTVKHVECPTNYTYYRQTNQCLKLYSNAKTFPDAKITCEGDSGHLVYPKTAERNTQMAAMESETWLGAQKGTSDGWEWLDGQPVGPYKNWADGKPDGNEDAVYAGSQGRWDDIMSNYGLPFICEIDVGDVTSLGC